MHWWIQGGAGSYSLRHLLAEVLTNTLGTSSENRTPAKLHPSPCDSWRPSMNNPGSATVKGCSNIKRKEKKHCNGGDGGGNLQFYFYRARYNLFNF